MGQDKSVWTLISCNALQVDQSKTLSGLFQLPQKLSTAGGFAASVLLKQCTARTTDDIVFHSNGSKEYIIS